MYNKEIIQPLIKEVKKGDVISFDKLFEQYGKKIYIFSYSYLKVKEEAEEIVQEVFISLWNKRKVIKEQHDFNAYLFTITLNAIRKRFRTLSREKKKIDKFSETITRADNSTNVQVEYNNLMEFAQKAIDQLPSKQRKVYILSKQEGLSNQEISVKLNITKKTVENHLNRAKSFLKKILIDESLLSMLFFFFFIK